MSPVAVSLLGVWGLVGGLESASKEMQLLPRDPRKLVQTNKKQTVGFGV